MTSTPLSDVAPGVRGRMRSLDVDMWWPLALVVIGAVGLIAGIMIIDAAPVGVYADDAMYVILARSIATGQGLRVLNLPGAPYAIHFPPGYPLILSALWRLAPSFPDNVMLFKAFNAVCLGIVAVGVARFMRERVGGPALAAGIGLLTAVSVPLLFLGALLLSELTFLALLMLVLAALERFADERAPIWRAVALGVAVGACALVRTHGVVLAPAAGLVLACRGRWRDAVTLVGAAFLTLFPWQLWSARHAGAFTGPLLGTYGSYGAWWRMGYDAMGSSLFVRTLRETIPQTYATFAVLFAPVNTSATLVVTMVLLLACIAFAVRAYWRRLPVTLVFLLGYLTILELWPGPPLRMLWGLWPLFLMLFAIGAREMARAARHRGIAMRLLAAAAVLWLVVGYGSYEWRGLRGQWWETHSRLAGAQIRGLVAWTRTYTQPNDVVSTDAEGAVFLYTGRHTVPVRTFTVDQFFGDPPADLELRRGLIPLLARFPVRAVITASPGSAATASLLAAPPSPRLGLAGSYPWGAAFTVLPTPAPTSTR